jgi:RHS repeat-associated protein
VSGGADPEYLAAYRYDAAGQSVDSYTAAGNSVEVPFRYQGRILQSADGATDLYDFGARSYDPSLASFISFDTVTGSAQNPLTLNRYLYALANPATMVDPTGHWAYQDKGCPVQYCGTEADKKADAAGPSETTTVPVTVVKNGKSVAVELAVPTVPNASPMCPAHRGWWPENRAWFLWVRCWVLARRCSSTALIPPSPKQSRGGGSSRRPTWSSRSFAESGSHRWMRTSHRTWATRRSPSWCPVGAVASTSRHHGSAAYVSGGFGHCGTNPVVNSGGMLQWGPPPGDVYGGIQVVPQVFQLWGPPEGEC